MKKQLRASAFPYMQFILQFFHLQATHMEARSSDQQTWARVQREWAQRDGMNSGAACSVPVEPTTPSIPETFKNSRRRVNWNNHLMESGNLQVEGERAGGGECQNKEMQEFYCCTIIV